MFKATRAIAGLQEFPTACFRDSVPWAVPQQLIFVPFTTIYPGHLYRDFRFALPESKAEAAVTSLKVEPGS